MRTFVCDCGSRVFFDNTRCVACRRELAFLPDRSRMATLEPDGEGIRVVGLDGAAYRHCQNRPDQAVCNWLVPAEDPASLCQSCRLTRVIPNLADETNHRLWADVEQAKRYLVYTLNQLGLPVEPKSASPRGLAFEFKQDLPHERVMTGHAGGVVTINIREADPVARELARVSLMEGYRTLLGHLRHEVGHYYWDVLIKDTPAIEGFRALFGDDREDYAEALQRHYGNGLGPTNWGSSHISAYASVHAWEDWAETWAHYLHMVDTLETAHAYGLAAPIVEPASASGNSFDRLVTDWANVTVALNELNRSLGMPDAYPFAITTQVQQKLRFIADVVHDAVGASSR